MIIHSSSNKISFTALIGLVSISGFFFLKYISRLTELAPFLAILYSLFLIFIILKNTVIPDFFTQTKFRYGLMVVFSLSMVFLFLKIPVDTLNVDRWSVISSFWDTTFSGKFSYTAKSHLGNPPGPFPFYFLLTLPFYLIGEIGYFSLGAVILLFVYFEKELKTDRERFILIIILLSSIATLWEVITRSTILMNSALILIFVNHLWKRNNESFAELIVLGLIGGFLLSTRALVAIPYIVFFSNKFLINFQFKKSAIFASSLLLGFGLTFLPLILWDFQLLLKFNPITLQSGFTSTLVFAVVCLLALMAGLIVKSQKKLNLLTGVLIFLIVLYYLIELILKLGYEEAINNSIADISYLIFSMPFFYYSLFAKEEALAH